MDKFRVLGAWGDQKTNPKQKVSFAKSILGLMTRTDDRPIVFEAADVVPAPIVGCAQINVACRRDEGRKEGKM